MTNFKQYLTEMTSYEKKVYQDPKKAYQYALQQGKRFQEAEPYILQDLEWTYSYARNIIKGRWPEAEPHILKDPYQSYRYAKFIIGGRWPEAEPIILKDLDLFKSYIFNISKHKQDVYRNVIEHDPENIKHFEDSDKENQELAIKLGGKRILLLIKNLDPEIRSRYPEIVNLKRSGLFK